MPSQGNRLPRAEIPGVRPLTGMGKRSRCRRRHVTFAVLTALISLLLAFAPASANTGSGANTHGHPFNSGDPIYLADHRIQEWSVNTYSANPPVAEFDDDVHLGLEQIFEPTDLTINRGARNTIQDVIFVPHNGSSTYATCY